MESENSADEPDFDLFGNPLLPIRDRRGRPSFAKTKENQDFVSVRSASGWSHKRIAEDMGIDEKTLRKYFSRELEFGATFVDGMMLDVLMRKAREGHMPAVRHLRERIAGSAPSAPRNRPGDDAGDDEETKPEKPGKKELARQRAQDVPDNYGDIFARLKGPH